MPRTMRGDVAALFPPLLPSCIARVSRILQARGFEPLRDLPELDVVSLSLNEVAACLEMGRLT
eukprot:12344556-Alexandrium_andersonii.AAC.1